MPTCQNCGCHVTEAYVRVFSPNNIMDPEVCPFCPDKLRVGAEPRDARSTTRHDRRNADD